VISELTQRQMCTAEAESCSLNKVTHVPSCVDQSLVETHPIFNTAWVSYSRIYFIFDLFIIVVI